MDLTRSQVFLELARTVFQEQDHLEPTMVTILSNFLQLIGKPSQTCNAVNMKSIIVCVSFLRSLKILYFIIRQIVHGAKYYFRIHLIPLFLNEFSI